MIKIKHLNLPPNNHGEGLIWIEKTNELAWVDVFEDPKIRILNLDNNKHTTISVPGPITSIAPHESGGFVAGMNGGFYLITYNKDPVHLVSPKKMHANELLNDGRCDSRGRYLCGSMDIGMKDEIGKIYQRNSDGEVKIVDENLSVRQAESLAKKTKTQTTKTKLKPADTLKTGLFPINGSSFLHLN